MQTCSEKTGANRQKGSAAMTCTITSRGFELLLALQIAPPERFPKNALSILKCNLLEILCALVEKGYTDFYVNGAYGIPCLLYTSDAADD